MAKSLTPKQKSAIERARRNPDLKRILFRKATGVHWFAAFKDAGFFDQTKIPRPIPSEKEGYVGIPAWPITDYLVSTSGELLDPENEPYAIEVIEFIRAVTRYAKEHGFGNYRAWWQFSKVISDIPPHLIKPDDIDLLDYWLDDLYERGLVAENLGEHWLLRLLDRADEQCKVISMGVLAALYKIKTISEPSSNKQKAVLRFDNWHAKRITKKVAGKVGLVLGLPGVDLFRSLLEHILLTVKADSYSSIWRPAIEDHGQNQSVDHLEDIILEGYRDSLLAYIEAAAPASKEYVRRMLNSEFETIKRIAIYAVDRQYQHLNELVAPIIQRQHLSSNFRHEMWNLLHHHYSECSREEKLLIQKAIESLHVLDENGEQSESATAYRRSIWLSAIREYGDDVAQLYRSYTDSVGAEPKHPEFSAYMSGDGVIDFEAQSPISKEELISLSVEQLVVRLESYRDTPRFGEPGIEGLVKVVRQIIKQEPLRFHKELSRLLRLDLAYIYEIIQAYSELWSEKAQLPWEEVWEYLLAFGEEIVGQQRFWSTENAQRRPSFVANRYWVESEIGRLIESGTKSDEHAIPAKFLAQAERVLGIILEKETGEQFKLEDDAVSVAVNSSRGRCIEALINLTLRCCRLADKAIGDHAETWRHFQPIYDAELARADLGEYEFVTLVARYLPNFLYISKDWTLANLNKIFDQQIYHKWLCAMQGYACVNHVYKDIYNHFKQGNDFLQALDDENIRQTVNDKIVQNIAIAYVNGLEQLDDESSLIHQLVARKKYSEIRELIWFLWTLRKDRNPKLYDKIFELWPHILRVIDAGTSEGRSLASNLCDWTEFVDEVNDENRSLILSVARYADENHHSYDLLKSVARISERQPFEAYEIWREMLETANADYPNDAIRTALGNIIGLGQEGERKAKQVVDQYLKRGNEGPLKIFQSIINAEASV